jgi:hypothetical protein
MRIILCAEDIIKRCVWDHYVYYVLGSDKEGEKILKENKEFEITEKDALVIGLLKTIETENLIHKFNTYIVDLLSNKSINNNQQTVLRKRTLETSVDKFLDKFPDYWTPDLVFKKSLIDLVDYIDIFKKNIEKLDIVKVTDQMGTYDFL